MNAYRSFFTAATTAEREANFADYWNFSQRHAGELFEADRDLARKRAKLKSFKDSPVRSRQKLTNEADFYRNYVDFKDDPAQFDRKLLLMTTIYKFARHEWVGISGAWDVVPDMASSHQLTDKISRVHLAEEFCHTRLFEQMLHTFHLDQVEWVRLPPTQEFIYRWFPKLPGWLMDPPAFITELLGLVFYLHLDRLFDEILADEPEACQRLHELLAEIMVDELAHVGQRRNFLGPIGIRWSYWTIKPLFNVFFGDIPEARHLFNVEQLISDALNFDIARMPKHLIERSWIPSYCQGEPEGAGAPA